MAAVGMKNYGDGYVAILRPVARDERKDYAPWTHWAVLYTVVDGRRREISRDLTHDDGWLEVADELHTNAT